MRYISIRLMALQFCFLLTACSGGGDALQANNSAATDETDTESGYSLSLQLLDDLEQEVSLISQAQPGRLQASLTFNSQPVAGQIISFSTDPVGAINPTLGTSLTNSEGVAEVSLLAGSLEGAATASATYSVNDINLASEINFYTAGDALEGTSTDTNVAIVLSLLDGLGGNNINDRTISEAIPGYVQVQVRDSQLLPLAGELATFSSTLGNCIPASCTALTDNNGLATVVLEAGSIAGAGEVTVTVGDGTASLGFMTLGDVIDPNSLVPEVRFAIYDCNDVADWDRNVKNFDVCSETNNITNTAPGILGIEVTQASSNQPLSQSLVLGVTTLGAISPVSGTAITDANGRSILDLYANGDVGAGEITVTVSGESTTQAFEVGRVDVALAVTSVIDTDTLPAGGSTIIEVEVQNADGSLALDAPFIIELSSDCSTAGLASIDTPINTIGGIGVATYQAAGCNGLDRVIASVQTGGSSVTGSVDLMVSGAEVGSIQYRSAIPTQLAIQGSGGITDAGSNRSETSLVTFALLDQTGAPAAQQLVCFELATDIGGMSLDPTPIGENISQCINIPDGADLGKYAAGYTNSEGLVAVTVRAGMVATPVKVFAMWTNGEQIISNVSDELVVSSGLADNNSFSVSASVGNPEGWQIDNQLSQINVLAADHFNNPVPDGTAVTFWSEGGSVDATCTTTNGACRVTWRSQSPRPFVDTMAVCALADSNGNTTPPCVSDSIGPVRLDVESVEGQGISYLDKALPGRVSVLAFAVGEESFVDLNGNGQFDTGEQFTDLSEAFRDDNEDGYFRNYSPDGNIIGNVAAGAVNEVPVDFNNDGEFNGQDGLYTGLLCNSSSAGSCSSTGVDGGNAHLNVRRNITIVMAGSTPYVKFSNANDYQIFDESSVIDLTTDSGSATQSIVMYLTDENNNPMPFGTSITATTTNGVLTLGNSYTFPNTIADRALTFGFTLERETSSNGRSEGNLQITVQSPLGDPVTYLIPVLDN